MNQTNRRIAAVHDLSGVGKCSLTTALPILSATGLEVCPLPTAVLSTQTGGIEDYTCLDLSGQLMPIVQHWKSLGLRFDAVYTGFLSSAKQISLISEVIRELKGEDTLVMVDPVMADNGSYYPIYSSSMADGMRALCRQADVIVPNVTEAAFLLDEPYHEPPFSREELLHYCQALSKLGPSVVAMTGVCLEDGELGACLLDRRHGLFEYYSVRRTPGLYHGTGDIFACALLSGLMTGCDPCKALHIAVDYTAGCIRRTYAAGCDPRFGVDFEHGLPGLIRALGL